MAELPSLEQILAAPTLFAALGLPAEACDVLAAGTSSRSQAVGPEFEEPIDIQLENTAQHSKAYHESNLATGAERTTECVRQRLLWVCPLRSARTIPVSRRFRGSDGEVALQAACATRSSG